jgi:methyl-accepting chemotaxis protein
MIASVATGMAEQSTAMGQISRAAQSMRQQAEQTTRALAEQSRAMKDMSQAAENTAKQIKRITTANREQSTVSSALVGMLNEVRQVTDRNAHGANETRGGTTDLLQRAESLLLLAERQGGRHPRRGGTTGRANGGR